MLPHLDIIASSNLASQLKSRNKVKETSELNNLIQIPGSKGLLLPRETPLLCEEVTTSKAAKMKGKTNEVKQIKKALIIMGNGPSRKKLSRKTYENYDTFEINYSIRLFANLKRLPTFYGSFDHLVTESLREEINHLLNTKTKDVNQVFANTQGEKLADTYQKLKACAYAEQQESNPKTNVITIPYVYSGVNAAHIGIMMKYSEILLTGIDCRYQEIEMRNNHEYEINTVQGIAMEVTESSALQSNNANYWNKNYHRQGDYIRKPKNDNTQYFEWLDLKKKAKGIANIYNISKESELDIFEYKKYRRINK